MTYKITPPGEPVPITATFGFVCKWCGGERQVIYGFSAAHECSEYHSAIEDMNFVLEQIRIHEGMPSRTEVYEQLMETVRQANERP